MSLFSTPVSVLAFGLALAASSAQALEPVLLACDCESHQSGPSVVSTLDLGDGLVLLEETLYEDGVATGDRTVVAQCASDLSIAVPVETWSEADAVQAFVQSSMASAEVMTFSDLSGRLDRAFGGAVLGQSQAAEVEACDQFYPEMHGGKGAHGA